MNNFFHKKRSGLLMLVLTGILVLASAGVYVYRMAYSPNFQTNQTAYVYISDAYDFSQLTRQLQDSAGCKNINSFVRMARLLQYAPLLKTGRYAIYPQQSNIEVLNTLRRGNQTATRFTFNNIRFVEDLAERIDEQLMMSKNEILALLSDSAVCTSLGFDKQTIKCMFIPNTYEIYWNITPENFLKRMQREYTAFWNQKRLDKAAKAGLTPVEVATLASIVEEETAAADEYPVVAGLYINRLNKGMPLQADPTIKFALGNFSLQRILFEHLEVDSPYNTYKHAGLPPAPLRIPSIKAMDAVLNYMQHNYLYMCAKEDFSGRHNFAVTLAQHNRNADRYRQELNRRNIR